MKRAISIDTSTSCLYLCLRDKSGEFHAKTLKNHKHSENLLSSVRGILKEYDTQEIDELYITTGPGSFTGLRIGLSCVKGMSSALGVPVFGLSTLCTYAYCAYERLKADGKIQQRVLIVPTMDARKDRLYAGVFLATPERDELEQLLPDSDISLQSLVPKIVENDARDVCFLHSDDLNIESSYFSKLAVNVKILSIDECMNPAEILIKRAKDVLSVAQGPNYIRPVDAVVFEG